MIKKGDKVQFDYTLTVDGNIQDTSSGRGPLAYEHGAGHIIRGLEKELEGMKVGDKKTVHVTAAEGYGELNPEAFKKVPASAITNAQELKVGDRVGGSSPTGQHFHAVISKIENGEVELNFNHPLAGKELHFEVEIKKIN